MKKVVLGMLLAAGASVAGCKKEDTSPAASLPDTSSSGKNILACLVNGQKRVYSGKGSFFNINGVGYGVSSDHITFSATSSSYDDDVIFHISNKNPAPNTKHPLSDGDTTYALYLKQHGSSVSEYKTILRSGWYQLSRFDNDVAAGTFAFTAYLEGVKGYDSVFVTDGRFDISRD